MKVNTQSIMRTEGASLDIKFSISPDQMPIAFEGFEIEENIVLEGSLVNTGHQLFRLIATLRTTVAGPCARCLEKTEYRVEQTLSETFAPEGHAVFAKADQMADEHDMPDEIVYYVYQRHEIDLAQAIRDNLLLALPTRMICSSACKGLCPVCGQNLNHKQCDCTVDKPTRESPFDRLKELL